MLNISTLIVAGLAAATAPGGCPAGEVTSVGAGEVRICASASAAPQPGELVTLTRLQPVAGPSRPPHFLWQKIARVRVVSTEDGMIVGRVEHGQARAGDRVRADW